MHRPTLQIALLLSFTLPTLAQSPQQFDVAAIKQNVTPSGHSHIYFSSSDGKFQAINVPLKQLLQFAFAIPDTRIENVPAWAASEKFDIDAKSDPALDAHLKALPDAQARAEKLLMLQALFADRFHLTTHRESKILPVYALIVANSKTGPTLEPAKAGSQFSNSRDHIVDQGATLDILAEQLARETGRPVLNQTAAAGRFDFTLRWTPDPAPGPADPSAPTAPSLFTALQEQLGLKLESQKAPVEVLVVDQIDPPTPN
jgi:uncharacterized protein (TIGR03435 family)